MGSACRIPRTNPDGSWASGLGSGSHTRDFWSKVLKHPGDGCWEWMGCRDKDGYGRLSTRIDGRRASLRPHRVVYELATGTKLGDQLLMHLCDNPKCVRPDHLRPGTAAENVADMYAKGRQFTPPDQKGEANRGAILTENDVRRIRAYRGVPGAINLLAKLYGMSRSGLRHAMRGATWPHVVGCASDRMPIERLRELVAQRAGGKA